MPEPLASQEVQESSVVLLCMALAVTLPVQLLRGSRVWMASTAVAAAVVDEAVSSDKLAVTASTAAGGAVVAVAVLLLAVQEALLPTRALEGTVVTVPAVEMAHGRAAVAVARSTANGPVPVQTAGPV